jgi:hypothetical protein
MFLITIIILIISIYICYKINNISNYERKYIDIDFKLANMKSNKICPICNYDLEDYECVYIRKICNHMYHEDCLIKYFKHKKIYEPSCKACQIYK